MIKKSLQEFTMMTTTTIDTTAKGSSSRCCYPATLALNEREKSQLEQQQQRDDLANAIANNKGWGISSSLLHNLLKETTTTAFVTTGFPDVRVGGLDMMMFPPTTKLQWPPYSNHYYHPKTNDSILIDSEIIVNKTISSSSSFSPNRSRDNYDSIDKVMARKSYRKRKRGSGLVRSRHLLCLSSILDSQSGAGGAGSVTAQPPSHDYQCKISEVECHFPSKRIKVISTPVAPLALSRLCINNANKNDHDTTVKNHRNDDFSSIPWSNTTAANDDDKTNANIKNKNINEEARGHLQSLSMYIQKESTAAAPTVNNKTTIPSAISLHENAQSSHHRHHHKQQQQEQQSDTLIHSLLLRCPFPTCP